MRGPFERNTWDSSSPESHSATTPTDVHSQELWGLLFAALEPWAGAMVWSWDSLFLRGDLCSSYIPPNFYPLHVGVGPAPSGFPPFLLVLMWLLYYILKL